MRTRLGEMTFQAHQARSGDFSPAALGEGRPHRASDPSCLGRVCVQGVSTRRASSMSRNVRSGRTLRSPSPKSAVRPPGPTRALPPGVSAPWGKRLTSFLTHAIEISCGPSSGMDQRPPTFALSWRVLAVKMAACEPIRRPARPRQEAVPSPNRETLPVPPPASIVAAPRS